MIKLDRPELLPDQETARDAQDLTELENGKLPPVILGINCTY